MELTTLHRKIQINYFLVNQADSDRESSSSKFGTKMYIINHNSLSFPKTLTATTCRTFTGNLPPISSTIRVQYMFTLVACE